MKTFDEYKRFPHSCIFCDGNNIYNAGEEFYGTHLIISIQCEDCGEDWTEEYDVDLTTITYYDNTLNRAMELE